MRSALGRTSGLVRAYWLLLPVLTGLVAGAHVAGQLITDWPRPVGLGYWVTVAFLLWWPPALIAAATLRLRHIPRGRKTLAGVLLLSCAFGTLLSLVPHRMVYVFLDAKGIETLPFIPFCPASLQEILGVFVTFSPFMATWLLVSIFFLFVLRAPVLGDFVLLSSPSKDVPGAGTEPQGSPSATDGVSLTTALPDGYGEILSIKAEDHYVRVRTDAGQRMLLMKFADAIADLPESQGIRVHRSYWANLGRTVQLQRNGQRLQLVLDTGETIPVSRRYAEAVRSALERPSNG